MDTKKELNKTVSEMNHIVKEIIKVAEKSNKEEQSKILILSQLLDKTEKLIEDMKTPEKELHLALEQQRRYIMSEVEDRMYRIEMEVFSRLKLLIEREGRQYEF